MVGRGWTKMMPDAGWGTRDEECCFSRLRRDRNDVGKWCWMQDSGLWRGVTFRWLSNQDISHGDLSLLLVGMLGSNFQLLRLCRCCKPDSVWQSHPSFGWTILNLKECSTCCLLLHIWQFLQSPWTNYQLSFLFLTRKKMNYFHSRFLLLAFQKGVSSLLHRIIQVFPVPE